MVTGLSNKDRDIQEAYDRGSIPASMETFPYFSSHVNIQVGAGHSNH